MIKNLITVFLTMLLGNFANADTLKVALVLDKGGKDDKSFNSSAYAGAVKAQKELGIDLKFAEATDNNAIENLHRSFARKNFDLVIGVGFAQKEAVRKVSSQYPKVKFAIIDGEVTAPNVRALMFLEQEGSFLVGALAAMKSKTGKIGFVGGMDIPLIRRFSLGYIAGAMQINPKIKISENYIGVTGEAWNNPAKAKELARTQMSQGADVIFAAAGASNTGVFDAAEEQKRFAIGVDSNQNWMKPGVILTSMLKAVDVVVFTTIEQTKKEKFSSGISYLGLKNKGVDYTLDSHNEKLITPEMKSKVEDLKKKIIAGQISVPDYYEQNKALAQ